MLAVLYAIVVFVASFLGASAGLGGGVIIKPALDFIGAHDLNTISFLSTSTVFTMALYSTGKQLHSKVKFDTAMVLMVAFGAMLGGNLGNTMFTTLLEAMNQHLLKSLQAIILAILLVIVLFHVNVPHKNFRIKNKLAMFLIGLILGTISSFLGIGGGPINVAFFIFFFSIDMKTATIYSVATILFSQTSKLFTIACSTGFAMFDLSLLVYTLPMAILGGMIGTKVNQKASERVIKQIFNMTVLCIIALNVYNAVKILL